MTVTKFLQRRSHKKLCMCVYTHYVHLNNNRKERHRVTAPYKNKHLSSDKVKKVLSPVSLRNPNKNNGQFHSVSFP